MKRIRLIELWANIKANAVAFLSIAMFVALGVGLFLGIQWGAFALRDTALDAMDSSNMHDISIQFPYGITESDLKQVRDVEGVSEVEPGYSCFVLMQDGNNTQTLKVQSLPTNINKPLSIKGNLPIEKNEIALLGLRAQILNIGIGDTIKLVHDAKTTTDSNGNTIEDKDGMEMLKSDTYTVTALIESAEYVYRNKTSLGVSNVGSGSVDCVGYVPNESFDMGKLDGAYTNLYIRCDSLKGKSVFAPEYKNDVAPVVDSLTKLGATLGTVRYNDIHKKAQQKLDEAKSKLDDGEKQLSEGKQKIADGEKALAEGQEKIDAGEKALVDGVVSGSATQNSAQIQLQEAYRQLAEGQAKYDAGVATYLEITDMYNQLLSSFGTVEDSYDRVLANQNSVGSQIDGLGAEVDGLSSALDAYNDSQSDEDWQSVESSYADFHDAYSQTVDDYNALNSDIQSVTGALGDVRSLDEAPSIPSGITRESADSVVGELRNAIDGLAGGLNSTSFVTLRIGDVEVPLSGISDAIGSLADKMSNTKQTLEDSKQQLDDGWDTYYQKKAEYDAGVADGQAKLISSEQQLRNGKEDLASKSEELEDGKKTLQDKTKELEDGKEKYKKAEDAFNQLIEFEWVVLPRQANGAVQGLITLSNMMDNVKWAMALLFILVGLFVCYSAIARLVHEQIVQIGTKKALGFRQREITISYLAFSGLSVLLGVLTSLLIAVLLVQGIMNPKVANQLALGEFAPHFSLIDTVVMGLIEAVLILFATWFAVRGLLKRNAIELLAGESTANAKEHFYERTAWWQRMSLFSQTVVNNCVNDKRRVIGTLIGVVGCTALIVVAVTLASNIANSFTTHYNRVYDFDAFTHLTEADAKKAENVALALYNRGITSAPAYITKLQSRKSDGTRNVVTLTVPTNEDSFSKLFKVNSVDGKPSNIEEGGVWISAAYASHQGVKVGDDVTLTEFSGKTHTFRVSGIYEYYLLRYEFVLSQNEYREAFGNKPAPNMLLTKLGDADISRTRDALADVDGYSSLEDDKSESSYSYDEMNGIMRTVVLIYLLLSALMALMVLLNLDIMFVNEKKRELIVLMICGFSTKAAKAYIYRDSIVLTIIGIVLGIALGTVMGGFTVASLEPEVAFWLKGFSGIAALVGTVGAGVFSAAVLLYALRLIPRFDLTDINRF